MNEFIVWDKERKRFRYDQASNHIAIGKQIDYMEDKLTIHQYIGKTDDTPQKNKIYADCSIVEFDRLTLFGDFDKKQIGVFRYCSETLRYVLVTKDTNLTTGYVRGIKNIKVIGTIQEDKHLLTGGNNG